jgi:uncharacterized protein (TIGR00661 family)
MNILYGLSGEGYGHSSRALLIIPFLQKLGHSVKVLTYNRGVEVLKGRFDVFEIHGARLIFKNNKIQKFDTLVYNLIEFPKNFFDKDLKSEISNFAPDLCITDYEPLTYFISRKMRIPLISIGNHHAISFLGKFPRKFPFDYFSTKFVNKLFTPSADCFIITSIEKPINKIKNVFFVSPLVRPEIKKLKIRKDGPIVVYLNNADYVLKILRKVGAEFIVYGFDKNKKEGNIQFRKKENFLKDLAVCKGIIATSGFTLISEALYLGKPYMAIPQKGQYEQVFNALSVEKIGAGVYPKHLDENAILDFIINLKKYRVKARINPDEIFTVLSKILNKFKKRDSLLNSGEKR